MSIKGKAVASKAMAHRIAGLIINANMQASKLYPIPGKIMLDLAVWECIRLSNALNRTPQEHFNSKGQIDKRKVRKHKRKSGFKLHTARILRPNNNRISSESYVLGDNA